MLTQFCKSASDDSNSSTHQREQEHTDAKADSQLGNQEGTAEGEHGADNADSDQPNSHATSQEIGVETANRFGVVTQLRLYCVHRQLLINPHFAQNGRVLSANPVIRIEK